MINKYRVALLRKEFPFLDRLYMEGCLTEIQPEEVTDIKIRKGDKSLLQEMGYEEGGGNFDVNHKHYKMYHAICGTRIFHLSSAGYGINPDSGKRNYWDTNTIGEQLFVKKIVPDYIVECVKNEGDKNGCGITRFWTIYKMKKFDLTEYHQDQIDLHATIIKDEIAAAHA